MWLSPRRRTKATTFSTNKTYQRSDSYIFYFYFFNNMLCWTSPMLVVCKLNFKKYVWLIIKRAWRRRCWKCWCFGWFSHKRKRVCCSLYSIPPSYVKGSFLSFSYEAASMQVCIALVLVWEWKKRRRQEESFIGRMLHRIIYFHYTIQPLPAGNMLTTGFSSRICDNCKFLGNLSSVG